MTKIAVREGQLVVPTCPECGCRLQKYQDTSTYSHFMKWNWWIEKDARGCSCSLLSQWFEVNNGEVMPVFL